LRLGAITKEMLEVYLKNIQVVDSKKHYQTNISIMRIDLQKQNWQEAIVWAKSKKKKIGILADKKIIEKFADQVDVTYILTENNDLNLASKKLFSGLRFLDRIELDLDIVFVQSFEGEALPLKARSFI
jgi:L-threonylcarbamoyladenylate synthase